MPRLTAIDPQQATPRVKPLFDTVQRMLGTTPNMMRTMAQSPAVLEGYLGLLGALARGSLGSRIGEQIALLTAEENGCTYCASAHTALGLAGGLTEDDVSTARAGFARDPRADAALTLARAILESRGHIVDSDFEAARQAGLTDGQIAEVVAHVALNVFTNYFNTVAGTEVDFPTVRAPRVPAVARQSATV